MRQETNAAPSHAHSVPEADASDLIQRRIDRISAWLSENAARCTDEQKHLDEGTTERAYWHYGYLVALKDIQKLLGLKEPVN